MKHLLHILVFVSLALPIASTAVGAPPSSSKPNLVVIFIDDLGYGDIGPSKPTLNSSKGCPASGPGAFTASVG